MRARSWPILLSVAMLGLVAASGPSSPASSQDEACPTHSPIAAVRGGPDAPGSPGVNRRFAYDDFAFPRFYGPDSGPGVIQPQDDGSVTVQTTNQEVLYRFQVPGSRLWGGGLGDGIYTQRGDQVAVFETSGERSMATGRSWVIPKDLAHGTYDPRQVGVEVGAGAPFTIADRNGDGVSDLVLLHFSSGDDPDNGTTSIVSGAVVDRTPSGSSVPSSATLATIPGILDGFAHIEGPIPAVGVYGLEQRAGWVVTRSRSATEVTMRVYDGQTVQAFTTAPDTVVPPSPGDGTTVAWRADDGNYLSTSLFDRAGADVTYWWRLDQCQPPSPEAPGPTGPVRPTPASPAEPQPGTADFTG